MKKKILALFTAAALMAAGVPAGVMAEGTSADKVTVNFSAGVPGAFDMVDEELTVQGDLAEKYFPSIKDNEPAGVSFADALVAAHIEKYGKDKVNDYLVISNGSYGTSVDKLFGHNNYAIMYADNKSLANGASDAIKTGQELFAGTCDGDWDVLYSYFDKRTIKTIAGKPFKIKLTGENWGNPAVPSQGIITQVNKNTGKTKALSIKTNKDGEANVIIKKAGKVYISANGKAESFGSQLSLAGALAKVSVGLDKAKITKVKAKGKNAVLKWKKVTGAKKYEVYKGTKKKGKFKKVATVKKTTYTDKKIKKSNKNKNYFYKVRAIAKADGKTVKGKFSKTARIKIKKAR